MRSLLIVDDQPSVRAALAYVFGLHGCEVTSAASGSEALGLPLRYEVALVDLHMPGLDGLAVCRGLHEKARAEGRNLPVWIMTAAPTREIVGAAMEAGAIAVVRKPFDYVELLAQIEKTLAQPTPLPMPPPIPMPTPGTQPAASPQPGPANSRISA